MVIQILVCLIITIAYHLYSSKILNRQLSSENALRNYIYFVCVVFILQSGLRNVAVGADTYAYLLKFEAIKHTSWDDIFYTFNKFYETGVGKDPGYLIFMKLCSLLVSNYQLYLIIIASLFFCALGYMLRMFCTSIYDVFIGAILYEVLFYGFFSITGIRQTIAVAILLFGIGFIKNGKLIPFIIICLLAAMIHKSALIFIPFYFIAHYKQPIKLLGIIILCLPLIFTATRPFAQFLTSFSFSESYASYANSEYETAGAQMFLIFMLAVSLMVFFCRKEINEASDKVKICYNAFSLGVLFTPLTWVDPSMMRVVMYFSVFSIFLLGDLTEMFCKRFSIPQNLFTFAMVILFVIVIIKRGGEYAFFWQDMALPYNYI